MRQLFKLTLLIAIVILMGASWMWRFAGSPLTVTAAPHVFVVKPGSTIRTVSRQLVEERVLDEPWNFMIMARLTGRASDLKAGNYQFSSGITPFQLFDMITSGDVSQIGITFIEGWTFRQMREELNRHEGIQHFTMGLSDSDIMQRIGATEKYPEGLFFPDTYYFSSGMTDLDILKRAYQAMQQKLASAWIKRDKNLPYAKPYDALIMASVVEKETGKSEERPMIARLFIDRLRIGMRLQTDPSVIYGLGEQFDGNLHKKDLLDDTPYNTYTRAGLPPTPIANPGLGAIEAALNPSPSQGYLYFVGKGNGSHAFSKTLAEHNRAVAKYQLGK
jgi:UPF0755 protein